jgi:hypothetical protein
LLNKKKKQTEKESSKVDVDTDDDSSDVCDLDDKSSIETDKWVEDLEGKPQKYVCSFLKFMSYLTVCLIDRMKTQKERGKRMYYYLFFFKSALCFTVCLTARLFILKTLILLSSKLCLEHQAQKVFNINKIACVEKMRCF